MNRAIAIALAALLALLIASMAVGFVWLPSAQKDFGAAGLWDAICRAAGVDRPWSAPVATVDPHASRVTIVPGVASGGDVGRGGTLALRCTMCHGARGVSASDIPNLAGQYPEVTYKQLLDYRNGQRTNAVMQSISAGLTDQDTRDLAAFYAQLPRPSPAPETPPAPRLVSVGDPIRNIAPCSACHGGIDRKHGSPWLEGMPDVYLTTQIAQFARGERRNDAFGIMRNVARQMRPEEVEAVARYYASRAVRFER